MKSIFVRTEGSMDERLPLSMFPAAENRCSGSAEVAGINRISPESRETEGNETAFYLHHERTPSSFSFVVEID